MPLSRAFQNHILILGMRYEAATGNSVPSQAPVDLQACSFGLAQAACPHPLLKSDGASVRAGCGNSRTARQSKDIHDLEYQFLRASAYARRNSAYTLRRMVARDR